jgi:hypothetical protein
MFIITGEWHSLSGEASLRLIDQLSTMLQDFGEHYHNGASKEKTTTTTLVETPQAMPEVKNMAYSDFARMTLKYKVRL